MLKSLNFRVMLCSRHLNFAIFQNREIPEINVSQKFHVIRYVRGGTGCSKDVQHLFRIIFFSPSSIKEFFFVE